MANLAGVACACAGVHNAQLFAACGAATALREAHRIMPTLLHLLRLLISCVRAAAPQLSPMMRAWCSSMLTAVPMCHIGTCLAVS